MENASNNQRVPVSLLSQARIAAGLSLQQLAEITRIPRRYLEALEAHDYTHFPPNLFVIGYLRNCADVLAVDINPLLNDYDLEEQQKASIAIDLAEHAEANRRYIFNLEKHQLQWLSCTFVAVLVVTLTVFLFFVGQNTPESDDLIDQHLAEPVYKEAEFISEPALEISRQDIISLATTEPKVVADQGSARIELAFKGLCWVDLTDARGQRVYRDLAEKGSKLEFSVKMPLELLLGDARQAEIFLNGRPFAIQSYRDDNSVRLTIDRP